MGKKKGASASEPAWLSEKLLTLPLAWIEARVAEDVHGCWVWRGAQSHGGLPAILTCGRGQQKTIDARRLVWRLVHGALAPRRLSPRCADNDLCCRPDHLRLQPLRCVRKSDALWREAVAQGRRRSSKVMSLEKARDIRASAEPLRVVAARLGISAGLASQVRRGLAWPEPFNPFGGLLLGVAR